MGQRIAADSTRPGGSAGNARPRSRARALRALVAACLAGCACSDVAAPDVVIVTWDTTRADHVGPDAAVPGLTPHWSRLAERGTRFTMARTPSPMTLPAHASLLTGLQPPDHGARVNSLYALEPSLPTLAERLRARGWQTGAFVSAAVLDASFGLDQGFDTYDDSLQVGVERTFAERRADATVDAALAWLDQVPEGEPLFLWLHLFDPHKPWAPPEAFASAHAAEPYRGEIAYTDQQTGRLLDALRSRGRLERTLLVMTSDHGEALGEHGEPSHGYFLYDATARVPLLFWAGERSGVTIPHGRAIDTPVLISDVAPTLLELLGLEPLPDGQPSLVPLLRGETPASRELAFESVDPYYFFGTAPAFAVVDTGGDVWIDLPRRERYDVESDPGQLHDLYTPAQESRADALFARHPRRWPPPEPNVVLDAERERQLAALGYLAGRAGTRDPRASGPRPDPKDVLPVAALWMGHGEDSRPDEALARAEALSERFGPLPALALFRADRLDELGRPQEAATVLRESSEAHPLESRLRQEMERRMQQLAAQRALADRIRETWEREPDHPTAMHDLAVVLHRLGETREAERLYRRWLERHPDDDASRLDLHRLLGGRGDLDEALTLLREVPPGPERAAQLDCAEGRLLAWWMERPQQAKAALRACREKGGDLEPRERVLIEEPA